MSNELKKSYFHSSTRRECCGIYLGRRWIVGWNRCRRESLAQRYPAFKIFKHGSNRGLGASIRTGLSAASGDVALTLDSDLTFPPAEIIFLINAFGPEVDAVFGSPSLGKFENVPVNRRILSSGVNLAYRVILGQNITAISSIFRLYRMEKIRALSLVSTSFDINAEIALKLLAAGAKIVEVPATLSTRRYGESHLDSTPGNKRPFYGSLKKPSSGAWQLSAD